MNETNDADRLRETFRAHERLAPDPETLYAGIYARARAFRRRRRSAQAAGGAVLGAGVVAAGVTVPGLVQQSGGQGGEQLTLAGGGAQASPPPYSTPSPLSSQAKADALNAYFAAGYGYDDALNLAKLWNMPGDAATIKAEAGRRLLAGQVLPVQPHPNPSASAGGFSQSPADLAALNAYFGAGYGYDDAVQLAQLWHSADPYHAKIAAGNKLLAGQVLPFAPAPQPSSTPNQSADASASADQTAVNAYFAAGYTYADAVQLAQLWHSADPYHAKIAAGNKLLAGQSLPIQP